MNSELIIVISCLLLLISTSIGVGIYYSSSGFSTFSGPSGSIPSKSSTKSIIPATPIPKVETWSDGSIKTSANDAYPPTCKDTSKSKWFTDLFKLEPSKWSDYQRNTVIYDLANIWKIGDSWQAKDNNTLSKWATTCQTI